jgi:S1-C subfamily serine protease
VQQEIKGEPFPANMFVPIDVLGPMLDAMLKTGRSPRPPRSWLGVSTPDPGGKLVVARISPGGLASRAGDRVGDMVLGGSGTAEHGLAEFFRAVWRLGKTGVEVPVTLSRGREVLHITVKSGDRNDSLRRPKLH